MSDYWISRDVAALIKEAADPITYGRLLCTARVFGLPKNVDTRRRRRKLKELLEQLPSGLTPTKTRSAYLFFSKVRREELKEELPDLTASEVMRQIGQDWRRLKQVEGGSAPYVAMSAQDRLRYEDHTKNWDKLVARRKLVADALSKCGDEEMLIELASTIRLQKRRRAGKEIWRNMGHQWHGLSCYQREQKQVYKRMKVPKPGRSVYNFYMKDVNARVRGELQKLQGEFAYQFNARVMREISVRWKSLTPEQREPYEDLARQDRLERAREALEDMD